jgi:hypothetical protein
MEKYGANSIEEVMATAQKLLLLLLDVLLKWRNRRYYFLSNKRKTQSRLSLKRLWVAYSAFFYAFTSSC